MDIKIWFKESAQGWKLNNIETTYTKGPFYCVRIEPNKTLKIPITNIFTVEEISDEHIQ